jgi:hypothetical protein
MESFWAAVLRRDPHAPASSNDGSSDKKAFGEQPVDLQHFSVRDPEVLL